MKLPLPKNAVRLAASSRFYRTLTLLRINSAAEPIYFIVHGMADPDEDVDSAHRYFYESHTCPMNVIGWDGDVQAIMTPGDTDPHGIFEFVRTAWMTQDWLDLKEKVEKENAGAAWGEEEDYLLETFPEINNGKAPEALVDAMLPPTAVFVATVSADVEPYNQDAQWIGNRVEMKWPRTPPEPTTTVPEAVAVAAAEYAMQQRLTVEGEITAFFQSAPDVYRWWSSEELMGR